MKAKDFLWPLLCTLTVHAQALDQGHDIDLPGRLFFTPEQRAAIDAAEDGKGHLSPEATRLDGLLSGPNQRTWRWLNGQLDNSAQTAVQATPPAQVGDRSDRPLLPENALRIERHRSLP
jgi:hypothetical protein